MTLSKKDKEAIVKLIKETLEQEAKTSTRQPDYGEWRENGIKSELTGLIIAPVDFYVYEDGKKKTEFTYDEAIEATKDLPDGWRLPTRQELVLIAEEFGLDDNGKLDGSELKESLGLAADEDGYGYYWSSTASSANNAYTLYFYSSSAGVNYNFKLNGFSIRCVAKS